MVTPEVLLFDLDGTLIDSESAICESASVAFGEMGIQVAPESILPHLGAPLDELYALFASQLPRDRCASFVELYIQAHDAHPEANPPALPGVVASLREMRSRWDIPMAVATTKPSDRARIQLEAIGLIDYFEHVQGTDIGMKPKPAPDVIHAALAQLDRKANERVYMVGDTKRDVSSARAAGVVPVAVCYRPQNRAAVDAFGAEFVVADFHELYRRFLDSADGLE
jgi:phosphoglycolate phosphatase-like HAD superfamily hydrolase